MFNKFKKPLANIKEFTDMTGSSIMDILAGNILTRKNLMQQGWFILFLFVLAFLYISNRYSCEKKIAEIDRLQRKLVDVRYDALTLSSELMELGKQSQVYRLVNEKERGKGDNEKLTESTTPPYKIKSE